MATVLFPWVREQDESHPILYSITSCLNYTRLYIRGLINGLFQKKKQGEGGKGEVQDMEFPGASKK